MDKSIIELASLFKARDNRSNNFDSFIVGRVINSPPTPLIQIDDDIFLDKDDLYFISTEQYLPSTELILIPSQNSDLFLVVGKAVQY